MAAQNLGDALLLLRALDLAPHPRELRFFIASCPLALEGCLTMRWVESTEDGVLLTERGRRALQGMQRASALGITRR